MSSVSIPTNVREMIQNLKEITGNQSEDEIYTALKECAMDPNEAANRLLSQDAFHEVRRKRERKKENLNKEPAELRRKPGMQGRGNRGGRGNYSSRYTSHDAGTRNTLPVKENGGINQVANEGAMHSIYPTPQEKKNIETTKVASASPIVSDGPGGIVSENTSVIVAHSFVEGGGGNQSEMPILTDETKIEGPPQQAPPVETSKNPTVFLGMGDVHMPFMPSSSNRPAPRTSTTSPGVYLSASDPILMPSQDLRLPVGTIRREVGSQRTTVEQVSDTSIEIKSTAYDGTTANSEVGSLFMQGNSPSEFHGVGKNQPLDSSRTATHGGSSVGRPSSNYGSRSQQAIGPQKLGPSKEWKKKPTNPIIAQGSGTIDSSEAPAIPVEAHTESHAMLQPAPNVLDSKDANFELERKLEESHISDNQHVIIPDHIHVPEAEKLGFCFGSFDATFDFNTRGLNCSVSEKSPSISEASEVIEESVEEQPSSNQIELVAVDDSDFPERPPSSSNIPEDLSAEGNVSSSVIPDYSESKQEAVLPAASHQYPVVHTSPNFSFGFMPPMLGNQIAPFESSESQARDGSRLPSFVVQQPFDPASYYAQFYRSGANSDGRISPFHLPGVATKYNGNVTIVSPQASQSSQEVGSSLMLSTAGPTPLVTQQAGVMQSSIAVTQQSLPVFRQPTGVHVPHYPPNYIPYAPYYPPFYVPSPTIHQFLSNGTFAQQPQATNIYPAPPVANSKYPLSQYKPGANTGNSPHIGMPGNYGPYGSSAAGYNPSPAATSGNSASNEELGGSQFKESNVYIGGQQSEGPGVWIAAPGRDISGLQASSFYNLPQAQVAFTPTQGGHGTFASIYHPAQPVTTGAVHPLLQQSQTMAGVVDMVGPAASVYAQPQTAQMNWPNNY